MKEATTSICLFIYLFSVALVSFGKVSAEQKQEVEKFGVKIYSWDEFLEVVGYYYSFSSYLLQICHEKAPSRITWLYHKILDTLLALQVLFLTLSPEMTRGSYVLRLFYRYFVVGLLI